MKKYLKYLPFLFLIATTGCSKNDHSSTDGTVTLPSDGNGTKYKGDWSVDSIDNGLLEFPQK